MMETEIIITPKGRIGVPDVEVRPGEDVQWIWPVEGAFTVQMEGISPLSGVTFASRGKSVRATVRPDAVPGTYKYTVAGVAPDGTILVTDPRMIVEPAPIRN